MRNFFKAIVQLRFHCAEISGVNYKIQDIKSLSTHYNEISYVTTRRRYSPKTRSIINLEMIKFFVDTLIRRLIDTIRWNEHNSSKIRHFHSQLGVFVSVFVHTHTQNVFQLRSSIVWPINVYCIVTEVNEKWLAKERMCINLLMWCFVDSYQETKWILIGMEVNMHKIWNVVNERDVFQFTRPPQITYGHITYCSLFSAHFAVMCTEFSITWLQFVMAIICVIFFFICISNFILIYAICGIFFFFFQTGGHATIEEQDPLPNEDINEENTLHHSQPVNSEFITISVSSNEQAEKAKEQLHNG